MHQQYDESTANLRELMTIAPISHQAHAAHRRAKVDIRRQMEDAREDAKQRSEEVL
jgi:predicted Holliday junction resolvase-like endonuclease